MPLYIPYPKNISKAELEHSTVAKNLKLPNEIPAWHEKNGVELAWFLQTVRDELSKKYNKEMPIIISSGYRSPELNKIVGGSGTSAHMKAHAADIKVNGLSTLELALFIAEKVQGYDQIIEEFGRWVHVGLSDNPRGQLLQANKSINGTKYVNLDATGGHV